MKYRCGKCGHEEEVSTKSFQCECGGLWILEYEPILKKRI